VGKCGIKVVDLVFESMRVQRLLVKVNTVVLSRGVCSLPSASFAVSTLGSVLQWKIQCAASELRQGPHPRNLPVQGMTCLVAHTNSE
jgi:hypothetical protein